MTSKRHGSRVAFFVCLMRGGKLFRISSEEEEKVVKSSGGRGERLHLFILSLVMWMLVIFKCGEVGMLVYEGAFERGEEKEIGGSSHPKSIDKRSFREGCLKI